MRTTESCIFTFDEIDASKRALVGGKAANLGELSGIEGINVPEGFCVSTEVFKRVLNRSSVNELLDQLSPLKADDHEKIGKLSSEIRKAIRQIPLPQDVTGEISRSLSKLGETGAYAVRSSATAEDLPAASFAGQQDTYLNITGKEAIVEHISKCWASLFNERAVVYRLQNGFGNRKVCLSVIVQKMVFPEAAGVMFTADPLTSNRKMISIEAGFGLGEALVSGRVNADNYKVLNNKLIEKRINNKKTGVYADPGGGTRNQAIEPEQQNVQALYDEQILQLAGIGRKIEAYFGRPQDIEWCLAGDVFYLVQSRPITTLYPIPKANDNENHVYLSVGHQQMMTDAMKPLGLSFFLLTTRALMREAGGRLFVDVTAMVASPSGRRTLLHNMAQHDPLMRDALTSVLERDNFIKPAPDDQPPDRPEKSIPPPGSEPQIANDPAIAADLINMELEAISRLKHNIQSKSGPALFEFIQDDLRQRQQALFDDPRRMSAIMAGMNASWWINEKMEEWLGEKRVADTLTQSAPNNITSEMGLELLNVADAIRPYPEVIGYLEEFAYSKESPSLTDTGSEDFLDKLAQLTGGRQVRGALETFLGNYGMRCPGEIDITKTRWSEAPWLLAPMILSNVKNFQAGAAARKFGQGRREALQKERTLLARLKQLPDGGKKAAETKEKIDYIRNFAGYREFPKYGIVSRYFIYKQALLKEARRLKKAGIIRETTDIYYLSFEELHKVALGRKPDYQLINRRKNDYEHFKKLSPPRVITSDGELIEGRYRQEELPSGAMAGLAVSTGITEGRARVILNMEDANLEEGDILVTRFTDPSWTALFVLAKGLVTEVGGFMTHGAVIAREYGLPAVIGVKNATRLIKDGERIRVNGTTGYVEIIRKFAGS